MESICYCDILAMDNLRHPSTTTHDDLQRGSLCFLRLPHRQIRSACTSSRSGVQLPDLASTTYVREGLSPSRQHHLMDFWATPCRRDANKEDVDLHVHVQTRSPYNLHAHARSDAYSCDLKAKSRLFFWLNIFMYLWIYVHLPFIANNSDAIIVVYGYMCTCVHPLEHSEARRPLMSSHRRATSSHRPSH